MMWPFTRERHELPAAAKVAVQRAGHSQALAADLARRSAAVSDDLRATLERNHIALTLEETMSGVQR